MEFSGIIHDAQTLQLLQKSLCSLALLFAELFVLPFSWLLRHPREMEESMGVARNIQNVTLLAGKNITFTRRGRQFFLHEH